MKIVVIGGTGRIGSKVIENLRERGHDAVAADLNTGVNTITGEGLDSGLAEAQVVVDLVNSRECPPARSKGRRTRTVCG
jgi:nucleoside-diphosphate-sugar epimerase